MKIKNEGLPFEIRYNCVDYVVPTGAMEINDDSLGNFTGNGYMIYSPDLELLDNVNFSYIDFPIKAEDEGKYNLWVRNMGDIIGSNSQYINYSILLDGSPIENIDKMAIFAGTHNEQSSYTLMRLMEEKGIQKNDTRIFFGQLYGMSDNISYNLAAHGYNVAKYLPFGPVRDVMPYLIRRAEENTSVAGQTSRELTLIKKEKERRKL
jgi:hypothetical protein